MIGLPGYIEHATRVVGALKDARSHQRSITAAFLDLENAFGSVSHVLILWALHRAGLS